MGKQINYNPHPNHTKSLYLHETGQNPVDGNFDALWELITHLLQRVDSLEKENAILCEMQNQRSRAINANLGD